MPSHKHIDKGQLSKEEERPERFRLIQLIYEETQGIEDNKICFISGEEHSSYQSAVKKEAWRQAMIEEMEGFEKNSTWELVKPCAKCKPISVKWIYRIKMNFTSEIIR